MINISKLKENQTMLKIYTIMTLTVSMTILIWLYSGNLLVLTHTTAAHTTKGGLHHEPTEFLACEKQQNVYYLKVHKTGSTTFSNILNRFGINRNLTFAIFQATHPYPTYNMLDYLIPHPADLSDSTHYIHKLNIVNVHSVFNKTAIDIFMPSDTKLVATIRHPFAQLQSAFNHYDLKSRLKIPNTDDPLKTFLQDPSKYDRLLPGSLYNKISAITGIKLSFTKNRMAFEFGFDLKQFENVTHISQHLLHVKKSFGIVIITEYYDESLLLLKKMFCWEYKDIVYLVLRRKSYRGKNQTAESYGPLYVNHKKWAPLDYLIYDHFLKIHRNNVLLQGPEFQDEVVHFRTVLSQVNKFCTEVCLPDSIRNKSMDYLDITRSVYHEEFTVSAKDCKLMMANDAYFARMLAKYQYREYCAAKSRNQTRQQDGASLKRMKTMTPDICGAKNKQISPNISLVDLLLNGNIEHNLVFEC